MQIKRVLFILPIMLFFNTNVFAALKPNKKFTQNYFNFNYDLYFYLNNPKLIYNDPLLYEQQHHEIMNNFKAWDHFSGDAKVVVAVTDDGVQTDHEDLLESIWINAGEIPHNGIDDDGNGFIDDIHGWDFADDDNNPSTKVSSHGTHVAGIIAAQRDNGVGISGTASGVTIMPIRFFGGVINPWKAEIVAKAYIYAANNGAKIINTSYNLNRFVGDEVFESALRYVYEKGVLIFSSAGNTAQHEPKKVAFEEILIVASTDTIKPRIDLASSFTSYGYGVDIAAPGGHIYSSVINNKYLRSSGTSMATPNAAAVAAAIWSKYPHYSREQVAATLLGTADIIDHLNNDKYKGKLGAGRVNTYKAVTQLPRLPRVLNATIRANELKLHLKGIFHKDSISKIENWKIIDAGKDGKLGSEDDALIEVKSINQYMIGTNFLKISLAQVPEGQLRVSTYDPLTDTFEREVPIFNLSVSPN